MTKTNAPTYTRRPVILMRDGTSEHLDRIEPPLEFLRYPCIAEDYERPGLLATAYITKTVEVSEAQFDRLLEDADRSAHDYLDGEGGHFGQGPLADSLLCVELKTPSGQTLLVNPEQGGAFWYVAELG